MKEKYIKRHLENEVKKASKYYPTVLVCGQRQVGKSTMLYHIKERKRNYVTFDDNAIRKLAKNDPDLRDDLVTGVQTCALPICLPLQAEKLMAKCLWFLMVIYLN